MATFEYQALTRSGRLMTGAMEASSADQAKQMLTEMELTVNSVEKAAPARPRTRIGRGEFLLFNQQLASIAKAGVPLERGLRELVADVESRSMRKLITCLADDLEAGMGIEDAFERRRNLFPPLYGQIVRAGVQTGRLSEMLTSLNRHLEISNQTRRIVFEAMSYPLVVLALAAVILSGVFGFLVPPMRAFFADMGSQLPGLTRLFFAIADNMIPFWIGVGVVVGGLVLLSFVLSTFPTGRRFKESIYMGIPVLGRVYHRGLLSHLADAMGLLVGAGADMPACLRLGAGATGSETLKAQCEIIAQRIEQGGNIVEAGQLCTAIPMLFFYSVQLGYQRNELEDNLYGLADMYTQQTRMNQSRLQGLLLPLMLILVGGVVASGVVAMFLPIMSLLNAVSQ